MGTGAAPYTNQLRPRVRIKTIDGNETLYTFDAFETSNPIGIAGLEVENAIGEAGTFNMVINDHNNEISKDNIHNVKVFIELGKTNTSFEHFLIGYGDIFQVDRPHTNAQFYRLNGFGSSLWAYQLFIHRKEIYKKGASDAKVYNIINNALTKRLWRPLKQNDISIRDIVGWNPSGISTDVNTEFRVIDKVFTYFGDLCDELCDLTGAVWFVDYSSGEEIFTLSYNPSLQVPIVIKSGDLADRVNDDPNKTAYIKNAFMVEDNASTEAGTATRLYTVTTSDETLIYEQEEHTSTGRTTLNNRAVAQQIVLDNDSRRIVSFEMRLEKFGEPESPNSRINGHIVKDNGSNKPAMNQEIDEFHIPLSSVSHASEFIKVDVEIDPKDLDISQSKIWFVLEDRSGINGEIQDDPDNTIGWFHNNIFNTNQTLYSGTAPAQEDPEDLNFTTTNMGPLYTLRVYSNIRRLFSRTNRVAADRIRLREQFLPTDFLTEPPDVIKFLSLALSKSSKGRRALGEFTCTVPDNFLFRPYQWVGFSDGLSDISDTLQVQRARYACGTTTGDPQLGTLSAEITLSGLYNTLIGACTCI